MFSKANIKWHSQALPLTQMGIASARVGTPCVEGLSFTVIFGVEWRMSSLHAALGQSKCYCHMALSSGNKTEHHSHVTEQSPIFLFCMCSLQSKRKHIPHPHFPPPPPPLPAHCLWAHLSSQHRPGSSKCHHLTFSTAGQKWAKLACQNQTAFTKRGAGFLLFAFCFAGFQGLHLEALRAFSAVQTYFNPALSQQMENLLSSAHTEVIR